MNTNGRKTYTTPKLTVHGTVEQITRKGPKQTNFTDWFKGTEGEGLPPGKIPGTEDAFTADSKS